MTTLGKKKVQLLVKDIYLHSLFSFFFSVRCFAVDLGILARALLAALHTPKQTESGLLEFMASANEQTSSFGADKGKDSKNSEL